MGEEIGRRLREIRQARGKSLAVVAGRAGISAGYLSRLEHGERRLDRRSLVAALASALEIAPQELTALPVPASADDGTDAAIAAIRHALQSVTLGVPDGQVQSAEQLTHRVNELLNARQACSNDFTAAALPPLIRDLYTSLAAPGADRRSLLLLASVLHPQGTQNYLHGMGASADLCWQAARLAGEAAEELAEPQALGVAAFGQANALLGWGQFGLADTVLRQAPVTAGEDEQLSGMLALTSSLIATATGRQAEAAAGLDEASQLAERTGDANRHWMMFGPTNVKMWRVSSALEIADYDLAAAQAALIDPRSILVPSRRANYHINVARALTPSRKRRTEAVAALRIAERISPAKVHRNPYARSAMSELLARAKQDAIGRELRGMAYRAGLPV